MRDFCVMFYLKRTQLLALVNKSLNACKLLDAFDADSKFDDTAAADAA